MSPLGEMSQLLAACGSSRPVLSSETSVLYMRKTIGADAESTAKYGSSVGGSPLSGVRNIGGAWPPAGPSAGPAATAATSSIAPTATARKNIRSPLPVIRAPSDRRPALPALVHHRRTPARVRAGRICPSLLGLRREPERDRRLPIQGCRFVRRASEDAEAHVRTAGVERPLPTA